MSNSRKVRGMQTQALVAKFFRTIGLYPWATDAGAGRSGKDVLNTPGASVEVKARASFDPVASLRQAQANTADGETPIVVCRMNGQGPARIGDWVAFTTLKDMAILLSHKGDKGSHDLNFEGDIEECGS